MKMRILIAASLSFSASPAHAGDMRFPKEGNPAITVTRSRWLANRCGRRTETCASPRSTAMMELLLSIVRFDGTLDEAAAETMKANHALPPSRGDAVTVSGLERLYLLFADGGQQRVL